jgi:hypothetical protein
MAPGSTPRGFSRQLCLLSRSIALVVAERIRVDDSASLDIIVMQQMIVEAR